MTLRIEDLQIKPPPRNHNQSTHPPLPPRALPLLLGKDDLQQPKHAETHEPEEERGRV